MIRLTPRVLLLLGLCLSGAGCNKSTPSSPEPYEFRGDRLGETRVEFESRHSGKFAVVFDDPKRPQLQLAEECTIGGIKCNGGCYGFYDGKLASIWVSLEGTSADERDRIADAITADYGNPVERKDSRDSLRGPWATWENGVSRILLWSDSPEAGVDTPVRGIVFAHADICQRNHEYDIELKRNIENDMLKNLRDRPNRTSPSLNSP